MLCTENMNRFWGLDQVPNSSPKSRQTVACTESQLQDKDCEPRESKIEYVFSYSISYNSMPFKKPVFWH